MRKKVLSEIGNFCESKDDVEIIKAQLEYPIKAYDYSESKNKAMIIALFVEWSHMLGIKEANTPEENIINAKFIITNFGDMTASQIRQAINWSITGRIPNLDATCYGKLSPLYMSKILNSYLDYSDKHMLIMRHKRTAAIQEQKLREKHYKPLEQRLADTRALYAKHMEEMKIKRIGDMSGMLIWKFLIRAKAIDPDVFTLEAKKYAEDKLEALRYDKNYRVDIQKLSKIKIKESEQHFFQRCMQDFVILTLLDSMDTIDLKKWVEKQPDDVVIPKEEQDTK